MTLQNIQKRKRLWRVLLLIGSFAFLLLLSYGFPVTGDDWWFTTRYQNESIPAAMRKGFRSAVNHFYTTNGRYFGNFLSSSMGCSKLLRELVRCSFIFGVFLSICRICKIRRLYTYLAALALTIALPAPLFAQTYAWAAGFFNYVPPALFVLIYLNTVISRFSGNQRESPMLALPYFFLGLCSQFFAENVTVALCLLSCIICVVWARRNKKISWCLAGHLAGALTGCILMFLAQGYRNVGAESYREIPQGLSALRGMARNFVLITSNLLENNWLVIGALTAFSLYLLFSLKASSARVRRLKNAAILMLFASSAFFYADQEVLHILQYNHYVTALIMLLDAVFVCCYLAGIVIAVWLCIDDPVEKWKVLLFLGSAICIIAPLLVVTPIGPRCLYLPHILLICTVLCIAQYCANAGVRRIVRLTVSLLACVVFISFLWMMFWNGRTEAIRVEHTEREMSQGAEEITLPRYPYQEYIHDSESLTIGHYYCYRTDNDISFIFVPYEQWNASD